MAKLGTSFKEIGRSVSPMVGNWPTNVRPVLEKVSHFYAARTLGGRCFRALNWTTPGGFLRGLYHRGGFCGHSCDHRCVFERYARCCSERLSVPRGLVQSWVEDQEHQLAEGLKKKAQYVQKLELLGVCSPMRSEGFPFIVWGSGGWTRVRFVCCVPARCRRGRRASSRVSSRVRR